MKIQLKLAAIFLFAVSLSFTGCSGDGNSLSSTTYAIGDTGPSGVGIVFYITEGGLHGLEAAPSLWNGGSEDPESVWIDGGLTQSTLNGNTSTGIGTGLANSNAIIAQLDHTESAAELCRDYTGGGLTDWFLPSKDEINELYTQKVVVGGFAADYYWSSSEYGASSAWVQYFTSGDQDDDNKSDAYYVRAVRAF